MHDVVIVGAGPVGLFLACELGLAGRSVLVLEQEPTPDSLWRALPLGLRGLSPASAETFYRRGLLHQVLTASGIDDYPGAPEKLTSPRHVGHFAGMMLDPADVDLAALPFRLPSPAMEGTMTNLDALETVLSKRAAELGVEIRRGVKVTAVTQNGENAIAHAAGQEYAARWLVGCDGGRSTVRKLAGFDFVGTEPQFIGYIMAATIADPEKLRPGFNRTPTGMYVQLPIDGPLAVMEFDGGAYDRTQQPSREHLEAVLRRVSGTDVTLSDVRLATTYTDRAMQATTYRQGRVLLAGDAAHIHSPLGGLGLNVGIGDALNLGWKLAATVRGDAPEGLLDTYTRERHPVGAWLLDWTRAQVATMKPDQHGRAVQALIRDLMGTRDGTTYMFEKLTGSSVRYDLGGEQPLVGRNVPEFRLQDGTRLGELMRDGRGVALDFTPGRRLHEAAMKWDKRIRYVAGPARDDLGFGAVLVRPDGIVAWAAGSTLDEKAFDQAATHWFGKIR
ncbi:FAD-dependent monooxygenase [Actinomadura graeca]|uniref:FAD-dependent monooxygenase n=1 Tax=Actinomadura graeca TaxID=2750812 RepID=A0ABX8QUK7_9ACTN|nr:FAD-dependent monooxygenase [Actinomadura graeca]QXJ22323.1 FAD-dependent monooxygenase [Actinomadura graeca]